MFFFFDGRYYAIDSVEVMLAAYALLSEWYCGQADTRYERLCMIGSLLEREGITHPLDTIAEMCNTCDWSDRHYSWRMQLAQTVLNSKDYETEIGTCMLT